MKHVMSFLAAGLMLLGAQVVNSDVLLIDKIQNAPVNSPEGIMRPSRGMTMEQVKAMYGEPVKAHPWVGEPPITRWDYPEYSVFFEHQYVLESVLHQPAVVEQ